jgi:hypothetical protein
MKDALGYQFLYLIEKSFIEKKIKIKKYMSLYETMSYPPKN